MRSTGPMVSTGGAVFAAASAFATLAVASGEPGYWLPALQPASGQCVVETGKSASPPTVPLGEAVTVSLSTNAVCP